MVCVCMSCVPVRVGYTSYVLLVCLVWCVCEVCGMSCWCVVCVCMIVCVVCGCWYMWYGMWVLCELVCDVRCVV